MTPTFAFELDVPNIGLTAMKFSAEINEIPP